MKIKPFIAIGKTHYVNANQIRRIDWEHGETNDYLVTITWKDGMKDYYALNTDEFIMLTYSLNNAEI